MTMIPTIDTIEKMLGQYLDVSLDPRLRGDDTVRVDDTVRGDVTVRGDDTMRGDIPMQNHSAATLLDASLRWHDNNYVMPAKAGIQANRKFIPDYSHTDTLYVAMTYAVMNGGKRLRPQLLFATGLALNAPAHTLE